MPVGANIVVQLQNDTTDPGFGMDEEGNDTSFLQALRAKFLHDLKMEENSFSGGIPLQRIWSFYDAPNLVQDNKEINALVACPEKIWLDVALTWAYYGRGYERGSLPYFVAIAEWCEANLSGCQVWYGPDSINAVKPFGPAEREELMQYYHEVGNEPYPNRRKEAQ